MKEKITVAVALLFPRDVHSSSIFLDPHLPRQASRFALSSSSLATLSVRSTIKVQKVGFSITFCAGFLKYFI